MGPSTRSVSSAASAFIVKATSCSTKGTALPSQSPSQRARQGARWRRKARASARPSAWTAAAVRERRQSAKSPGKQCSIGCEAAIPGAVQACRARSPRSPSPTPGAQGSGSGYPGPAEKLKLKGLRPKAGMPEPAPAPAAVKEEPAENLVAKPGSVLSLIPGPKAECLREAAGSGGEDPVSLDSLPQFFEAGLASSSPRKACKQAKRFCSWGFMGLSLLTLATNPQPCKNSYIPLTTTVSKSHEPLSCPAASKSLRPRLSGLP